MKKIVSIMLLLSVIFSVSPTIVLANDDESFEESTIYEEIDWTYIDENIDTDEATVNLMSASDYPTDLSSMRARADAIVNYKWTPAKDIKTWNGNKYNGTTTFKKGSTVKGMPYTLFTDEVVSDSLLSLKQYKNKVSSNYSTTKYCKSVSETRTGPVYGSCCATFVSEVFGGSLMSGDSPVHDSCIKLINSKYTKSFTGNVSEIKPGDALVNSGRSHVIWVYDITDKDIVICEQTPPVARKKTISKPSGGKTLYYEGASYPNIVRPTQLKDATKPAKPTISSADPDSDTQITVKWKAVNGATSYRVGLRRKDVKDYSDKTTTSTSYTFKNLTPGSTYYFRLYAVNKKGDSDRSATYMTYTMPSPPEQPTITCDSETQLTISWKKVSGASKYEIEYHKATDKDWKSLAKNLTGTSFTHTGLNEATKYNYRVRAIREGELGPDGNRKNKQIKSKYSKTKTKFTRLSSPETNRDNENVTHIKIKKWKEAKGDGKYTYSIVRKAPNESGFKEVGRTTDLTYVDKTGTPGTIYAYQIKILNQNEDGSFSTVGGTSTFYGAPKITKGIALTPLSATSMQVSWEKPMTEIGLTYIVKKWSDSKNDYETYATTNNTYFVDNNLVTGKTYKYYIQVRDNSDRYLTSTFDKAAVLEIPPTGIVLDKTALTMKTGETVMLNAVVTPDNSTNKSLTWTSSNSAIASVSNGTVTATGVGEADIYASTVNGKKAVCHVVVSPKECVHTYGDWIITKEATCETEGEQHRICSQCHQAEEKAPIPAKGHSYDGEWTVIKNAGCIEDGMKAHVCTVCGKNADETVIEATGHEFDENWQVEKAGNCHEEGIEYRTCKKCRERETRTTDTTAHEYELTKETETTPDGPGYKTYTCKICGDSYSEENVPEIVEGTIEIGAGAPKAGGLVTLPVTISENPGIAGFAFTVRYDKSVLTPKTITRGKLLSSGTFTSNLEQGIPASELKEVAVYWGDSQNMTENGELFNITFEVSGEVPDGVYAVTLDYEKGDVTDQDFNDVMPNIIDNLITVADVIKGDVNQDRIVDSQDGLLLSRYIAKWKIDLNDNQLTAANVFNDTKVNAKDGVRLSQILAGYEMSEAEGASLMSMNEVKLAMEEIEAGAGEIVTVPVTISDNEGIAGFNFRLDYDRNYLTPISVTKGELLLDGSFTTNLTEETDGEELEYITAYWNSADNMYDDGELFVVEFMVKDTAEIGEKLPLTLSYEDDDLCDYYLNDVNGVTTQGLITVTESEYDETDRDLSMGYYFSDITMKSAEGLPYNEIPVNGNFDLEVGFMAIYVTARDILPAKLIVAAYNDNGEMISIKTKDITADDIDAEVCKVHVDTCDRDISYLKIFIWDFTDAMRPLGDNCYVGASTD